MRWRNPIRLHLTIIGILCVAGTVASWWFLSKHRHSWMDWLVHWFPVVNLVTFGYYGFDKFLATRTVQLWWRVPELALHSLSVLGGSPAALLAMWTFRHKTIKRSFRILFWCTVVLQVALAAYIVKWAWWD